MLSVFILKTHMENGKWKWKDKISESNLRKDLVSSLIGLSFEGGNRQHLQMYDLLHWKK